MKKRLSVFIAVLLFSLIPVFSVSAFTVDINVDILNRENINSNTGWITIDVSQYEPWELGIRSIYVAMYTRLHSTCVGDTVGFYIRPYNDANNIRLQMVTSIHTNPANGDDHIQYVWLPINSSNKIEYMVDDLGCSYVDVRLWVVGYD